MGVASGVWSRSVQSASLQACLSTTHLDGRIRPGECHPGRSAPSPPPSNDATKETIIEKKNRFKANDNRFSRKNDFNIPSCYGSQNLVSGRFRLVS